MTALGAFPPNALAAGLLAPLAVWLLWRVQAFSVDRLLRGALFAVHRRRKWLYMTVSWFGTFLHEISHAVVLLLGGHGIKEFKVGAEQGHVTPKKTRRGAVGFLSFLAAAMAPIYVPPALILGLSWWLLDRGLLGTSDVGLGMEGMLGVMAELALTFPQRLTEALIGLDLATWSGAGIFALVLLGMPGSRPSFVKGSRFHDKDQGDIAVVRARLKRNPWPLVFFLLALYALYLVLVPLWPKVYWAAFGTAWRVALTGILLALFGTLWWHLVAWTTRIKWYVGWIPAALGIGLQVAMRQDAVEDLRIVNLVSLGAFSAATALMWVLFRKR